jgi:hypothetical protein
MKREDFPHIQLAASASSSYNQNRHFLYTKIKIALLLLTALVSAITFPQELQIYVGITYVTILLSGVFVSFYTSMRKYDQMWFNSRAVTESCKMESWYFLMKMKPYDGTDINEVNRLFNDNLMRILHEYPTVEVGIAGRVGGNQISEAMMQAREMPLNDRLSLYVTERLQNQLSWYRVNSERNRKNESDWFFIYWFLQFTSVVVAIIVIYFRHPLISPVGILTTASASALSWNNARRFQELSQTYGYVVTELIGINVDAEHASSQEELAEIVRDTEDVISREHTTWKVGRRG